MKTKPDGPDTPPIESEEVLWPGGSDRYVRHARIAVGALGAVFEAYDRLLERPVALCVLHEEQNTPSGRAHFTEVIGALACLSHAGMTPIYDVVEDADPPYYAMKRVAGISLAARLNDGSSLRSLIAVLAKVSETLAYAHGNRVVHGGLTPEKIRMGAFGEVIVMGWSAALARRREEPPDPAVDVRALGTLLQRALGIATSGQATDKPSALIAIARRAATAQSAETCSAEDVATALTAWQDGAQRVEEAQRYLHHLKTLTPELDALRQQAEQLRATSHDMLSTIAPWQSEADKADAWALEDQATSLTRQAIRMALEAEQRLYAALNIAPELPEAHITLAERQRNAHGAAEASQDQSEAHRLEVSLRTHAEALPSRHPVRVKTMAYLRGEGALSLISDPPGAEVLLYRYEVHRRRLLPVFQRSLGRTPLSQVPLPMGSYLCVLRSEGRPWVRYPVRIARQQHWDGVPPGSRTTHPIWLPEHLEPHECYVPAGWYLSGGDPEARMGLPARRLWVDALVVQRFPITERALVAYARAAASEGSRTARALLESRMPETDPDVPAVGVSWDTACAYATWLAERTGRPWRLPSELEWEKAARGVDGRAFPWGDFLDPAWCCTIDSHSGAPSPAPVDRFPVDVRVYAGGVLGGNAHDWCLDDFSTEGPRVIHQRVRPSPPDSDAIYRPQKGGAWNNFTRSARCADRTPGEPWQAQNDQSFRLVRTPAENTV